MQAKKIQNKKTAASELRKLRAQVAAVLLENPSKTFAPGFELMSSKDARAECDLRDLSQHDSFASLLSFSMYAITFTYTKSPQSSLSLHTKAFLAITMYYQSMLRDRTALIRRIFHVFFASATQASPYFFLSYHPLVMLSLDFRDFGLSLLLQWHCFASRFFI